MKRLLLFIITIITIFWSPNESYGQIVLGPAASKFVLYTSSGAVSDNASAHSHLTGDVGTSTPGPITGFGNVDGVMHPGADVATAACNLDLLATIAQLNAVPATLFPSSTMGSGTVFTPGVYSIPGNATLTLDLILDAQSNPNAEFIIKIGGTFGTNVNSKVKLINGALACHVYWQITGAVTMASLSTMRGNIISGGAISMGSGDSLEGRAFSTVGLIGIDGITAFMPIGCNSPLLTGPKLPDLASIGCYTIFTSNGALANTAGTSVITGDVGKNNNGSSITGWVPADVTGTLHSVQDPSTILAAADLSKLYDTLNAMVPDIELLYPAQFGRNLVLTPHVYVMNGATTFTDSIYLNAQGNPDAVFVIKIIGGALTTSTYSKVKLMNGAQSRNVFWVVQGAVSINNYSVFRGTIVIPVGALNFVNLGIVLDGRALTMSGAITTEGLTAANPPSSFIATEPVSQIGCAGSPVMFTIKAAGSGLTYRWRKGNVNLTNAGNISGADNDTLLINPAGMSDTASNYNVIITGGCSANDTSNNVSLTLSSPPVITTEPTNQASCSGSAVLFFVKATGSGLTYRWRKGSVDLINGINISGVGSDTLRLNSVAATDTASNYNVIVSGTCLPGDTSNNVSLSLNSALVITTEPASQVSCGGAAVMFTVKATGSGLTYRWRKGNVNLNNAGNISGALSDTLRINPTSAADTASNYNVIVSGTCSPNDTSLNASLVINAAPVITVEPINQVSCEGGAIMFTVKATGSGLTYRWRKGTVNLSNTGNISGALSDTLRINPASAADTASNYNVIVSGICTPNDTSNSVSLIVTPTPVAVTGSNSPVCSGNAINLTAQTVTGATYQWTGPNGYLSPAQNPVILNATTVQAGVYTLTVFVGLCSSVPATVTVVVNNCDSADLSIVKTVDNVHPVIGSSVVFTIVAENKGPRTATAITITDVLPSGYTYVSSSSTKGTYSPSTGIWTIDSLVNNATATLTMTAVVNASGVYINTATIDGFEFDKDTLNNISSVETFPSDFFIPQGFSPNGDGTNDLFVIRGIDQYPANTFTIFNRWGNKVFDGNPYKSEWDGKSTSGITIGGEVLPVGTYFYVLDLGDGSDIIKGTIYLNK